MSERKDPNAPFEVPLEDGRVARWCLKCHRSFFTEAGSGEVLCEHHRRLANWELATFVVFVGAVIVLLASYYVWG